MIAHDAGRPQGAPGASEGHTVSFWHDLTSCVLRGRAMLQAGRVSFDWAEQKVYKDHDYGLLLWTVCWTNFSLLENNRLRRTNKLGRSLYLKANHLCPETKVETTKQWKSCSWGKKGLQCRILTQNWPNAPTAALPNVERVGQVMMCNVKVSSQWCSLFFFASIGCTQSS